MKHLSLHNVVDALLATAAAVNLIIRALGLEDRPWAQRVLRFGTDLVGAFQRKS